MTMSPSVATVLQLAAVAPPQKYTTPLRGGGHGSQHASPEPAPIVDTQGGGATAATAGSTDTSTWPAQRVAVVASLQRFAETQLGLGSAIGSFDQAKSLAEAWQLGPAAEVDRFVSGTGFVGVCPHYLCWGASLCAPVNYAINLYEYDVACAMFNAASVELLLARGVMQLVSRSAARGYPLKDADEQLATKIAYNVYCSAALRFDKARDIAERTLVPHMTQRQGHPEAHADMHPAALAALRDMCLAFAQSIGWAKHVVAKTLPLSARPSKNDALASKLAHQAALLWGRVAQNLEAVPPPTAQGGSTGVPPLMSKLSENGGGLALIHDLAVVHRAAFWANAHIFHARDIIDADPQGALVHALSAQAYLGVVSTASAAQLNPRSIVARCEAPSTAVARPSAGLVIADEVTASVAALTHTAKQLIDAVEYVIRVAGNARVDAAQRAAYDAAPEAFAARQQSSLPPPQELAKPKPLTVSSLAAPALQASSAAVGTTMIATAGLSP